MIDYVVRYWIEALFTLIVAFFTYKARFYWCKIKGQETEQHLLKEGILALLHDRIYSECMKMLSEQEISLTEFQNIEMLYRSYHALGGNGTGTELFHRVQQLKIVSQGA